MSRIATDLPGNLEKPSGGGVAWFVRNKAFAWESVPWPSEAEHIRELVSKELCIGVKVPDEDTKRALVQGWPDMFAVSETPWGGPKIIVRLQHVDEQLLRELIIDAWRTEAPKYLRKQYDDEHPVDEEADDGHLG